LPQPACAASIFRRATFRLRRREKLPEHFQAWPGQRARGRKFQLSRQRVRITRHGYQVLEAANGVEAISLWPAHCDAVALLVADLVMPAGISGQDLARQLQAAQPDVKVIFISGYSAELAGRELQLHAGENFIQKPFTADHLLETVRRSLDGKKASPERAIRCHPWHRAV
jgi:CheY-like chemotaxis protein